MAYLGDNREWFRSKRFEIFKLCVKTKVPVFSPKPSNSSFLVLAVQFLDVIFPVVLNGIERESSTVKINDDGSIPFHWVLTPALPDMQPQLRSGIVRLRVCAE